MDKPVNASHDDGDLPATPHPIYKDVVIVTVKNVEITPNHIVKCDSQKQQQRKSKERDASAY